ncbi:MAG: tyrosine-type recombinase/integrase [Candidatus Nealsonbacteria bacterium]|nr:tyrosine-type recombinase/integrase [Candidatus Nealsonbacteria bacterium]
MANSTRKRAVKKPAKPYPDFPLFAHATRRWAKKIRGKLVYFGPWDDPDGALQRYLDDKDDLHAGRTPQGKTIGLTVRDLVNHFLTFKQQKVEREEIAQHTFQLYHKACGRLVRAFGRSRLVSDIRSEDFSRLNANLAKTLAPATRKLEIILTRSVFRYAYKTRLIDREVVFGPGFDVPTARVLRKARQANGPKMFEADEITTMLGAASAPLRALILLGVNCGFGNNDCATLPVTALDLDAGWIEHARPKTGAERRCPLWPETVAALRLAIEKRAKPKGTPGDKLVFLTTQGNPMVRHLRTSDPDRITDGLRRLMRDLKLHRPGRNFYALRHTFETIGGESIDQVAVDHIMGHQRGDMASVYRERISDTRLQAVVDHVRAWLFNSTENK